MKRSIVRAWKVLRDEGVSGFGSKIARKLRHILRLSTFKPYVRTLKPAGIPIKVPIVDLFSQDWYGDWQNTSAELYWIKNALLEPGDIVADCGANVGFTSVFFAHCVGPTGQVHAFEPLPSNAEAAGRSVKLNGVPHVRVVNAALGRVRGTANLSIGFGNAVVGGPAGDVQVPVMTLDEYFGETQPDFLKIDVEGYELEVLQGASRVLARRPKLAIEIHCSSMQRPAEAIAVILGLLHLADSEAHIQLQVEGPIDPFDPAVHTPQAIARFNNVHLFAKPRATGASR